MDRGEVGFDAAALIGLGRVVAVEPSPCGRWAAAVVERLDEDGAKYIGDLWRVPLDGRGSPHRLTVGGYRDRAPCFRADGALGFLSDRPPLGAKAANAQARSQVWLLPPDGGEARPITDEPLGVSAFRFAPAGDRLVVLTSLRPEVALGAQREVDEDQQKRGSSLRRYRAMPVRFWDHWLSQAEPHLVAFDQAGGARRDLFPEPGEALREATWALSPDGARVAVTWGVMNPRDRSHDRPLVVVDCETGERRALGERPGVVHVAPVFSPDGSSLAVTRYTRTSTQYGPKTLWRYDLDDAALGDAAARELTGAWDRWPVPWAWTEDGRAVVVTADDGGRHPIFTVDAESGAVERISAERAGGVHLSLRVIAGRGALACVRSTLLSPPEPSVVELLPGSLPTPLASLSGLDPELPARLAVVRELHIPSGEGRSVQAFVVEPRERPAGERKSFLWIHGGPVNAWRDEWHWRWSVLPFVARGYTLVMPNPAGSTGFGQAWANGIWGNTWGATCYEDLLAVVDALEREEGLPSSSMVAMGGSFGGYMTNWIGANTERFRLLVSHAGIFSLSSFYGRTDMPAWWLLMMGISPYEDADAYDRFSPRRRIDRWRTPTLILHGERDYRVPIGESLELFEALQLHGVTSELMVFPDEHHWILKPPNSVAWYEGVLDFVARHWDDGAARGEG